MEKTKLFEALSGLYAYDIGYTDRGISDPLLKEAVRTFLVSQCKKDQGYPDILAEFIRDHFLSDEAIKQKSGVEDVLDFIHWIDDELFLIT